MKTIKLVMIAVVFMTISNAYSQKPNRGDVCQEIPNLSAQQKSEINKLSTQHQKSMDVLRTQFHSENEIAIAREIKTKMNTEQNSHYQAISNLLTVEQKIWFDQNCIRVSGKGFGRGQTYGRGQGFGRGQDYGRGQGYRRGQGFGRGQGFNRVPIQ